MRFEKTERVRQEVARRSGALTAVQRRLLILVDGHKTVNALDGFVRVGERDDALAQLLQLGLIQAEGVAAELEPAVAEGFSHPVPLEPPRAATNEQAFAEVRAEAARFVHNGWGPASRSARPSRAAAIPRNCARCCVESKSSSASGWTPRPPSLRAPLRPPVAVNRRRACLGMSATVQEVWQMGMRRY